MYFSYIRFIFLFYVKILTRDKTLDLLVFSYFFSVSIVLENLLGQHEKLWKELGRYPPSYQHL